MAREDGMRYRDFAVITGDLPSYGSIVRQVFSEEDIPFFIDEKRALIHNPFVEYLRAALEACTENYSYDSIFRMLKTGMSDLTEDEIDSLENYVIALGIRGKKKWRSKWVLVYQGEDPAEVPAINAAREKTAGLLDDLADALARRNSTVREKTAAVYEFCIRSRIQEKLSGRENYFRENGRPDLAREYAQVFGRIMRIDLHKNFRSRHEIIETVNGLFSQLMRREIGGVEYDERAALSSDDVMGNASEGGLDKDVEIMGQSDPFLFPAALSADQGFTDGRRAGKCTEGTGRLD